MCRGQHLRDAVPPTPDRTRRRPGGAVADEVPRRPLGCRRGRRHHRRRRPRRATGLLPELRRCHPWPPGVLSRPARDEDPARADGPPLCERPPSRGLAPGPRRRLPCLLPRPGDTPAVRHRRKADGRLRRDALLRVGRHPRRGQPGRQRDGGVHARGVTRRRGVPHRTARCDDTRLHPPRTAHRGRAHRRPGAGKRRRRTRRRPQARPRTGDRGRDRVSRDPDGSTDRAVADRGHSKNESGCRRLRLYPRDALDAHTLGVLHLGKGLLDDLRAAGVVRHDDGRDDCDQPEGDVLASNSVDRCALGECPLQAVLQIVQVDVVTGRHYLDLRGYLAHVRREAWSG